MIFDKGIILLFLVISILSCSKENTQITPNTSLENECNGDIDLGVFYFEESTNEFIPYDKSNHKIVFSDSIGSQISGQITEDTLRIRGNRLSRIYECEHDSTQTYLYWYDREYRFVKIILDEIDVRLNLILTSYVSIGEQDELESSDSIFIFDLLSLRLFTPIIDTTSMGPPARENSNLSIMVNPRNHPYATISSPVSPTYNLHGINFFDVFYVDSPIEEGEFRILYNTHKGIIGLENFDKSISLKYEYIE